MHHERCKYAQTVSILPATPPGYRRKRAPHLVRATVEQGKSFVAVRRPVDLRNPLPSSQKENCKNRKTSIPFQMGCGKLAREGLPGCLFTHLVISPLVDLSRCRLH